jgi:hypothetical protein
MATTVVEVVSTFRRPPSWRFTRRTDSGLAAPPVARARGARRPRGFCFLLAGDAATPEATERLEVLVREADGFPSPKKTSRLRGPGEFPGNAATRCACLQGGQSAPRSRPRRAQQRSGQDAARKRPLVSAAPTEALPVAPARGAGRRQRRHNFPEKSSSMSIPRWRWPIVRPKILPETTREV